eukprot:gene12242-biopygen14138
MEGVVVRGLVAQKELPSGTPVLSVPISHTLRDDKVSPAYSGAPWNASLAAYLLSERSKGSNSSMWPYLCTLPADCSGSPLLLPADMVPEVQYPPAVVALQAFQKFARESYEQWKEQQQQQQQQQQYSWSDWCWALHMVQSRSIRLAITGCKVMIPGIDLLNHGGSAANGQLVLSRASWQVEGEPAICFVTTRSIAAGEQQLVCWAVQHLPSLHTLQSQVQPDKLASLADEVADRAMQGASARCSSAAIPGTSSSLLMEQDCLPQQLQQQDGQGRRVEAAMAALRGSVLQRRLASFRLHRSDWGTGSCPSSAPELVLKRDGCIDVRVPIVLAALQDQVAEHSVNSSISNGTTADLLKQLLNARCQQLLRLFATSVQQDESWLLHQQEGTSHNSGLDNGQLLPRALFAPVVQYRQEKKKLLQAQIALTAD